MLETRQERAPVASFIPPRKQAHAPAAFCRTLPPAALFSLTSAAVPSAWTRVNVGPFCAADRCRAKGCVHACAIHACPPTLTQPSPRSHNQDTHIGVEAWESGVRWPSAAMVPYRRRDNLGQFMTGRRHNRHLLPERHGTSLSGTAVAVQAGNSARSLRQPSDCVVLPGCWHRLLLLPWCQQTSLDLIPSLLPHNRITLLVHQQTLCRGLIPQSCTGSKTKRH